MLLFRQSVVCQQNCGVTEISVFHEGFFIGKFFLAVVTLVLLQVSNNWFLLSYLHVLLSQAIFYKKICDYGKSKLDISYLGDCLVVKFLWYVCHTQDRT